MGFNVMGAKQAGYTDQEIQQYLASKGQGTSQPQTQPQESGGLGKTLLPLGGSILGGLLGIPLGVPGIIGGGAAGGAAGGALAGGSLPDILKEALLGGVGGIFPASRIGKVAGAGARVAEKATAGGVSGKIAGLGQTMRRSVVNPKVIPSPFAAEKEAEIASKLTSQVGGSAQAMRQKSGPMVRQIGKQIDEALAANNPGIDPNFAKRTVDSSLQNVAAYDMSDPVFKQASSVLLKKITSLKTAKDAVQYKQELSGMLGPAFTKLEKGAPLTQREEALMATWKSLDEIISGSAPHIKDLTLQQSTFYQAAPGLAAKAKQVARIPFTGIPIPGGARGIQAGTDLLGRGLEAGGNAAGRIPIPAGLAPNIVGQVGTRALTGNMPEAQAAEMPTQESLTSSAPAQSEQDQLRQALGMYALSKAKSVSDLTGAYNLLYPKKAATEAADVFLNKANQTIQQIESMSKRGYGPIQGRLYEGAFKLAGGAGAPQDVVKLNQLYTVLKLNVLRAYQGARISDKDFELAQLYIPNLSDTEQVARTKVRVLQDLLTNAQPPEQSGSESTIPMPASPTL